MKSRSTFPWRFVSSWFYMMAVDILRLFVDLSGFDPEQVAAGSLAICLVPGQLRLGIWDRS